MERTERRRFEMMREEEKEMGMESMMRRRGVMAPLLIKDIAGLIPLKRQKLEMMREGENEIGMKLMMCRSDKKVNEDLYTQICRCSSSLLVGLRRCTYIATTSSIRAPTLAIRHTSRCSHSHQSVAAVARLTCHLYAVVAAPSLLEPASRCYAAAHVGAIAPQSLQTLLQSIHECLQSSDWGTRKAAAEALSSLASHSRHLVADGASSTIAVLEACRFDKDLRRPSGHSKQGGYRYLRRSPIGGLRRLVPGRGAQKRESGFRPSALRGGDGKYYARGGHATKGSFSQRDWRGGHGSEQGRQHDVTVQTPVHEFDDSGSKATPRKRLVKKSGDRERTPDFGIEDEEPAFMRDEFASEPPSSQKRKGSKEDGFRKKEKKLKGDKKFDKEGKMSSKGGRLSAIYLARSRDEGARDTVRGGFEEDQEGVRTMDDDNFIDDTLEWIRLTRD
ncbi:hypothetical protein Syun_026995 [Stephania yunnanensis]|uniref:TORTIFOLIA1/SINE1-2 N-terminal domain-containing protein n=1 Tax=Stephania yunnanensis TaxID=152371 RepID=A0AAP0HMC1_9MAGN